VILREEILKQHSKTHVLKIANYACQSKENFKELMKCFLDEEYRLSQSAVIRNSVRVLQEIEIPEKFHRKVMDACFQ
jgi:hypothetical protein